MSSTIFRMGFCKPKRTAQMTGMLLTEYKDLATYEKNLEKVDALLQTVIGNDKKQWQGYSERLEIREALQDRMAREIVLEPKR